MSVQRVNEMLSSIKGQREKLVVVCNSRGQVPSATIASRSSLHENARRLFIVLLIKAASANHHADCCIINVCR